MQTRTAALMFMHVLTCHHIAKCCTSQPDGARYVQTVKGLYEVHSGKLDCSFCMLSLSTGARMHTEPAVHPHLAAHPILLSMCLAC